MQKASWPHIRAFRDNYLAALLGAALLLISMSGGAQILAKPNGYGERIHRLAPDSALYVPTGCGVPTDSTFLFSQGFTGAGEKAKQAAKYYDSCGHHEYVWDPSQRAWHVTDAASGGSADTTNLSYRIDTLASTKADQLALDDSSAALRAAIGTGGGSGFSIRLITSSSFSTSVNCPLPALNNDSLQIFWNDLGRFLQEGSEWQNLAGGGFKILVPGFNASSSNYSLTLYANNIASPPGPQNFTSSSFSTSTNCPITAYNGMTLQIFWNDAQRYLVQGTDWTPLAGGGFTVTVAGFNASTTNYSFYVFAQ
jgi:hypothetical protein